MIKAIKYLFYRLHSISLSNHEQHPIFAFALVFLLVMANIYTIIDIMLIVLGQAFPILPAYVVWAYTGAVFIWLYRLLCVDGKAKTIVNEFEKADADKHSFRTLLLWIYIISSICLSIYTGNIARGLINT